MDELEHAMQRLVGRTAPGPWMVVQHDPVTGHWWVYGPWLDLAHAEREMATMRAGLDEQDLGEVELHIAELESTQ